MRSFWIITAALATASAGLAQDGGAPDVRYWSLREINFPVPLERYAKDAVKPTRLHFYVAERGGAWAEHAAKALNDLDLIDADQQRRGFRYVSPQDGQYDFALQLEYANGDLSPRTADLTPQRRVVVDTRPPLVRAAQLGRAGLQWQVQDENLGAGAVRLEARWVRDSQNPDASFDGAKFVPITPRGFTPKPVDQYTWTELKPGDVLEVRVVGRDKAGHETPSVPVRLPGDGVGNGLPPAAAGSGFGNPSEFAGGNPPGGAGQPRKDYSNTRNLTITSVLQKVTRSGVSRSYLWVRDASQKWSLVKDKPEDIPGEKADAKITWAHAVDKDGLFGFIVIPENGAGKKDADPLAGAVPQFLIEVDTAPPQAAITNVLVSGTAEPRVEIQWSAQDKNLDSMPILLEYAAREGAAEAEWKPLHEGRLPNSGRYSWAVSDPKVWQFYLRIRAVDLAGNETKTPYPKKVIVDLDTPKATIEKIAGNGPAKVQGAGSPVINTESREPALFQPPVSKSPEPAVSPVPVTPAPVTPPPATPGANPLGGPPTPVLPPETPK